MPRRVVPRLLRAHPTESWLVVVLLVICVGLSLTTAQGSAATADVYLIGIPIN